MEGQDRLVTRPTRPLVYGIALAASIAIAVLAFVLVTVVMHDARTATTSPGVITSSSHQAPDAKERNDIYAQALAERYRNLSPDAQERNEQTGQSQNP
jgi:hypothetical protein